MADYDYDVDVEPIHGSGARVAARLCNFVEGSANLLPAHINWMKANVAPIIRSQKNSWVDLWGFASKKGDLASNQILSENRCKSAKNEVATYAGQVNFNINKALGEESSGGSENDNWGFWRRVEIYVFAVPPPPNFKPAPRPPKTGSASRIIHRSFSKYETQGYNYVSGDVKEDTAKDAFKGILDILGIVIDPEGALGDEDLAARKTALFPINHRVNRVIIDQKLDFDFLTQHGIPVGTKTFRNATIDYEWGLPMPFVKIINKYQATVYKSVKPPVEKSTIVLRAQAELMPFIVPPKP